MFDCRYKRERGCTKLSKAFKEETGKKMTTGNTCTYHVPYWTLMRRAACISKAGLTRIGGAFGLSALIVSSVGSKSVLSGTAVVRVGA